MRKKYRDSERDHPLFHSPNNNQSLSSSKPILPNLPHGPSSAIFQAIGRELSQRRSSRDSNQSPYGEQHHRQSPSLLHHSASPKKWAENVNSQSQTMEFRRSGSLTSGKCKRKPARGFILP